MSAPDTTPTLARIVAAHKGAGPGQADLVAGLRAGFSRAIRRAALPFPTLSAQVAEVAVSPHASLQDAIDALSEHGLLAAIEDEDGRRGLICVDHPLVDALIEVQTTGHVEDADLPPRAITRIDEALCRDFLDMLFGAFAQETASNVGRDWPDRMNYGSIVMERAQLNLLLPEKGYHLLKTSVTAAGRKTGEVMMLLPVDAVLARRHAAKAGGAVQAAPVDWSKQMLSALSAAPMVLDAVLMRVVMPLGKVEALGVGDLVPFEHSDLSSVQLEGEGGHVFAKGALGQQGGKRAFRLSGDMGGGPTRAAATPQMAAPTPSATPVTAMQPTAMPPTSLPDLPSPAAPAGLPALAGGGFDPDAPMAGFDPDAAMAGLDPAALTGDFNPDAPMGGFDPNAPMG